MHDFDPQTSSCVPLLNATPPPVTTTETEPATSISPTIDSTASYFVESNQQDNVDDQKQDNNGNDIVPQIL